MVSNNDDGNKLRATQRKKVKDITGFNNMFEVSKQISATLKMMDIKLKYTRISHVDNLYLQPTGSGISKTGIYSPKEGVAFLLKFYTQKQEK